MLRGNEGKESFEGHCDYKATLQVGFTLIVTDAAKLLTRHYMTQSDIIRNGKGPTANARPNRADYMQVSLLDPYQRSTFSIVSWAISLGSIEVFRRLMLKPST
jgi:hypothetical protein